MNPSNHPPVAGSSTDLTRHGITACCTIVTPKRGKSNFTKRYIEEEWSPQASAHEFQNASRGFIFTLHPAATIVQEGDGMSFLEDSDSWIIFEIYAISADFHSDLVHFLGKLTDEDRLWNVDEVTNETQSGEICRVRWTSYRRVGASIFRPIEQNVY